MTEGQVPLKDQIFRRRDVTGTRFISCDLSGVVVRGSDVAGMEIDSPWLIESGNELVVNGVDVVPLVDAELNRRFSGRDLRASRDPDGLRRAWGALEETWDATCAHAEAMPEESLRARVQGEWSFIETLRHLIYVTDIWLGKAARRADSPFHPLGLSYDDEFDAEKPTDSSSFADVLEARRDRQIQVRDFLESVMDDILAEQRSNPHDPSFDEAVLSCIQTILEEEWSTTDTPSEI